MIRLILTIALFTAGTASADDLDLSQNKWVADEFDGKCRLVLKDKVGAEVGILAGKTSSSLYFINEKWKNEGNEKGFAMISQKGSDDPDAIIYGVRAENSTRIVATSIFSSDDHPINILTRNQPFLEIPNGDDWKLPVLPIFSQTYRDIDTCINKYERGSAFR